MLGGRAKFERERISMRSFKGSERAKARGVKRKAKLTDHQKRLLDDSQGQPAVSSYSRIG
jgi:DNA invertase Pin-like site-specific DNA recombinase